MLSTTLTCISFSLHLQQRQNLHVQLTALQADYDNLNARYEEESEAASIFRQQCSKIQAEFSAMKTKLEKELISKTEEYEELRYKKYFRQLDCDLPNIITWW